MLELTQPTLRLIAPSPTRTRSATAVLRDGSTERLARALADELARGALVGAQYAATTREGLTLGRTVGLADAASTRPLRASDALLSFSITKALTAIAVMQLSERGLLDLDEPVLALVPHPYDRAITARQLLAHTAGVPSPMPLDWFASEGTPFDRQALLRAALAKSPKSAAAPGTRVLYTNLGYWLLEAVVEAASGLDFAHYLATQVLGRVGLGARDATFELPAAELRARGHARRFHPATWALRALTPRALWSEPHGVWTRTADVLPHGRAYGGLFTNARALTRVLADLVRERPRLISAASRDELFTDVTLPSGKPSHQALGWVSGSVRGHAWVGKQGGGLGFHGAVRVYPALGLATTFLANTTELTAGPIDARADRLDAALLP